MAAAQTRPMTMEEEVKKYKKSSRARGLTGVFL